MANQIGTIFADSRVSSLGKAFYALLRERPNLTVAEAATALGDRNPKHLRTLANKLAELGYLEVHVVRDRSGKRIAFRFPSEVPMAS